jgi:diguanylate cyclase (GGDEF)-like protein
VRIGCVWSQVVGVAWLGFTQGGPLKFVLLWDTHPGGWITLTFVPLLSFAGAAIALLVLLFVRRTKVEQGLLWALAALFFGFNQATKPDVMLVYSGAAGLMLMFSVLEHGYEIANRDELTGLPGRRAFNRFVGELGKNYSVAMCDVDHFKKFNDTYGHEAGDQVLKMVASKLSCVQGGGRAFRYGGEEFVIVFRGRFASEARPFVESLRKAFAETPFVPRGADRPAKKPEQLPEILEKNSVTITISAGLAERSKRHSTPELVLDDADAALYSAKEAGRNRVVVAKTTSPSSVFRRAARARPAVPAHADVQEDQT